MDIYVCVQLEKGKYGYLYTCVISYLLLKFLCGKQVVKLFIVQEFGKLRVLYSLTRFPMLG